MLTPEQIRTTGERIRDSYKLRGERDDMYRGSHVVTAALHAVNARKNADRCDIDVVDNLQTSREYVGHVKELVRPPMPADSIIRDTRAFLKDIVDFNKETQRLFSSECKCIRRK